MDGVEEGRLVQKPDDWREERNMAGARTIV